jgi:cell wall-associated NlpC family hydrolase
MLMAVLKLRSVTAGDRWRLPVALAGLLATAALIACSSRLAVAQGSYKSPFSITLAPDIATWTSDFSARQAAIDDNTTPARSSWYLNSTSYADYPYGPLVPQLYSSGTVGSLADVNALRTDRGQPVLNVGLNTVPAGVSTTTWQQQRILAAANVFLQAGTHYQHFHMPNFDPRQVTSGTGFPWSPVSTGTSLKSTVDLDQGLSGTVPNPYAATYGSPQPGIDCTDFSSYVYNLALGIQMHSGTPNQVKFSGSGTLAPGNTASATVLDSSGNPLTPQFFYGPNFGTAVHNGTNSLTALVSQFQPGDLLYMGNPSDNLVHVVMWLGQTGTDSSGNTFPLVISSHDNTPAIFDTLALDPTGFPSDGNIAGHLPPPGVHILPFDASNWFYQDFQVAMRVVAVPEPSTWGMLLVAIACGGWRVRRRRTLVRRA